MPFEESKFDPAEFSGVARLFPLPNLIMFPHVIQPLHIYEQRYRDLLEDALAGDRLIAMAQLAPGWENDYEGRPAIHRMACLGRVTTHVRLADGCYNLLLSGVARLALGRELKPTTSFRRAKARICFDRYPSKFEERKESLQRRLFAAFRRALPHSAAAQNPLFHLHESDIDLAALTDIIGFTLDLPLPLKETLLAECNVLSRARRLLNYLEGDAESSERGPKFPPEFSRN
ncbi:MAG TPA: LON peptidase substrate-binding domain-containing protein [Pirellulales bacterium]|jgi:Lon protease-like protein